MNFEDEPYVRLYTRKTLTTKLIGWEGRTVLWHLMLEVDKAGVLDLDGEDEVDAVAALTELPIDVVKLGLSKLSSRGVTERHGNKLVITRYIEAQSARRSEKARAREHRERRRAGIVTNRDAEQTIRDETSQPVTSGNTASPCTVPVPVPKNVLSSASASGDARPKPAARASSASPVPLPQGWTPDDALVQSIAAKWTCDPQQIRAIVPEFVDYWTNRKGRGKRRSLTNWDTSFRRWADKAASSGELPPLRSDQAKAVPREMTAAELFRGVN